jgi:hypothetical protein
MPARQPHPDTRTILKLGERVVDGILEQHIFNDMGGMFEAVGWTKFAHIPSEEFRDMVRALQRGVDDDVLPDSDTIGNAYSTCRDACPKEFDLVQQDYLADQRVAFVTGFLLARRLARLFMERT